MIIKWLKQGDYKLTGDKEIEKVNSSSTCKKIFSLFFFLKDEIVGKKLLSLLPDEEKREVYRKIALRLPVSNLGIDYFFFSNNKFLDFKRQLTITQRRSKNKDIGASIAADCTLI